MSNISDSFNAIRSLASLILGLRGSVGPLNNTVIKLLVTRKNRVTVILPDTDAVRGSMER